MSGPAALSPRAQAALEELLLVLADDEFVLGYWDSEWTGIAPLLEEDVAMSSLAQDEIGHARAYYGLLGELTGRDPDAIAYDRDPDA
ncbi:MAG: Phenylacetic acid catabolic protein, partial [Candidatus Limnocylindrales bacterium]